jgi:dihydrofolate reductase
MISIIAAIGKNRELGKNGKIPWHISEDFKRFKQVTSGHPVIMGRKTWETLPIKPLPGRYNVVVTRDPEFTINGSKSGKDFIIAASLQEAIGSASIVVGSDEIFIIGGGQIYQQAISLADKLYLTVIDRTFDADTFFPDYSDFKKVVFEKESQEGEYKYKFLELEKQA